MRRAILSLPLMLSATAVVLLSVSTPVGAQSRAEQRVLDKIANAEATCSPAAVKAALLEAQQALPESTSVWYHSTLSALGTQDWANANYYASVARALAPFSGDALAATALTAATQGDPVAALANLDNLGTVCSSGCEQQIALARSAITTGTYQAPDTSIAGTALTKEQVKSVQTALNARGFDAGIADGIYGRGTRAALINYLKATGNGGRLTCSALDQLLEPAAASEPAKDMGLSALPQTDTPDPSATLVPIAPEDLIIFDPSNQ